MHRVEGLKDALENGSNNIEDFQLPVVILENVSKEDEITQFLQINTTAKKVKTDLASRLLKELYEKNEMHKNSIICKGDKWKMNGIKIADKLFELQNPPWYRRIRLPNAEKEETTISQTSFVESLRPVIAEGLLSTLVDKNIDTVVTIINNF